MPVVLLTWDPVFYWWTVLMDSKTRADDGSLVSRHTDYIMASVMVSNTVSGL